jgi:hypothetical protein
MQQQPHPSGQPSEKRFRASGAYTGNDSSNYEFQVNRIYIFVIRNFIFSM